MISGQLSVAAVAIGGNNGSPSDSANISDLSADSHHLTADRPQHDAAATKSADLENASDADDQDDDLAFADASDVGHY